MNAAVLLSGFLVAAGTARADSPPAYDVERYCRYFAGIGGTFSARDLETCRVQEARDRAAVARAWPAVDPPMRTHCDRFARAGEPANYHGLRMCLADELRAYIAGKERALGRP